ncbi:Na+/H+ antiporter NhaA, partial [Salmonella enterica]|uniref:Na+/H+ antiporter NhaA n=1 Tax=Salmonella enterica TaxID=28901 RepID=UPI0032B3503E
MGKQIGIFASVWLSIKCGWSTMPNNSTWLQVYGISLLCGIGFTMSLFIGLLAFPDSTAQGDAVKIGVLIGSLASGAVGATVLYLSTRTVEPTHT